MSFGYSIGDLMAGANLTYRVIHALTSSTGASDEYQEAINELGCMQQTFLQVGHLKRSHAVCQATINAVSHLVISSIETIGKFLEKIKLYQRRLSENYGGMAGSWQKVGWTLFKKEELMRLRDTLHVRLNAVNVLLSAARAQSIMPSGGKYQVDSYPSIAPQSSSPALTPVFATVPTPANDPAPAPPQPTPSPPTPPDTSKDEERFARLEKLLLDEKADREKREATKENLKKRRKEIAAAEKKVAEAATAAARKEAAEEAAKLKTEIIKEKKDAQEKAAKEKEKKDKKAAEAEKKKPIKFKDAVGRKFSFPFHLCNTWAGMEDLIRQAFLHVDIIGPHVADGHYDLVGPNGEIILPQVWETMVEPEWAVTMHMWPMPEPSQPEELKPTDRPSPTPTTPGLLRGLMKHVISF